MLSLRKSPTPARRYFVLIGCVLVAFGVALVTVGLATAGNSETLVRRALDLTWSAGFLVIFGPLAFWAFRRDVRRSPARPPKHEDPLPTDPSPVRVASTIFLFLAAMTALAGGFEAAAWVGGAAVPAGLVALLQARWVSSEEATRDRILMTGPGRRYSWR